MGQLRSRRALIPGLTDFWLSVGYGVRATACAGWVHSVYGICCFGVDASVIWWKYELQTVIYDMSTL